MLVVAAALSMAACAPELVAEYPGAGGPCDRLYRIGAVPAASCSYDWRGGRTALAGQAAPRSDALARIDNEIRGTLNRLALQP